MAGHGKGKHKKNKGKSKSKNANQPNTQPESSNSNLEKDQRGKNKPSELKESKNTNTYLNADKRKWKESNEDTLKKELQTTLENIYGQAFQKLLSLGYKKDVAQKAIAINGHGLGNLSILNNIVTSSIAYINRGFRTSSDVSLEGKHLPMILNEKVNCLQEIIINSVQEARPDWTKSNAMRHLLARNLYVEPASSIFPPPVQGEKQKKSGNSVHCDAKLHKDVGLLEKVNLTPALEAQLKENVSKLAAAFRTEMKDSSTNSPALVLDDIAKNEPTKMLDVEEDEMLSYIEKWIEIEPHPKNKLILSAVNHIRELKAQLKERKEWAKRKVVQAAQKVSQDLLELKLLRMDKMDKEKTMRAKQELKKHSMYTILEKENALQKANSELERVTEAVKRLEIENSGLRADIEACKLNTSESKRMELEFAKRERKHQKKVVAFEKQRMQLEEQIEEEKKKELQLRREWVEVKKAIEEAKVKLREEEERKELAIARVFEEAKSKEAMELEIKRKHSSLRQKFEIEYQLLKDQKQRLEAELSNLRTSNFSSPMLFEGTSKTYASQTDTSMTMPLESFILHGSFAEDTFSDRECVICSEKEASVLFLPCAHQVTCADCYESNVFGDWCPCCKVQIEDRVRVYGTSA